MKSLVSYILNDGRSVLLGLADERPPIMVGDCLKMVKEGLCVVTDIVWVQRSNYVDGANVGSSEFDLEIHMQTLCPEKGASHEREE